MKKSSLICVFLMGLMSLISDRGMTSNVTEWTKFLSNPTEITHKALVKELNNCNGTLSCKELIPSSEEVGKLIKLIEEKDTHAVDVAFLSRRLRLLDGGNLEDVNRALGHLAESEPKLLLKHLQKYKFSGRSFESTLVMLSLETVDDIDAQLCSVKKRIEGISSVNDPSLVQEKEKAMKVLKKELDDLQKLKKRM